jgi:hypothetical protein
MHARACTHRHARTHTHARARHARSHVLTWLPWPVPSRARSQLQRLRAHLASRCTSHGSVCFASGQRKARRRPRCLLFAAAGGRCNVVGCIASPRMQREGHGADRAEPRRGRYDRAAPALVRTPTAAFPAATARGLYCNRYQCEARRRRAGAPGASMCGRCGCPCAPGVRVRERACTGVRVCLPLNARRVPSAAAGRPARGRPREYY